MKNRSAQMLKAIGQTALDRVARVLVRRSFPLLRLVELWATQDTLPGQPNVKEKLRRFVARKVDLRQRYDWHFAEAMRNYQIANAPMSVRHFHECLRIDPSEWFALHCLSNVYSQIIGDAEESLRLLREARHLRERLWTPTEGKLSYRFLLPMWSAQI